MWWNVRRERKGDGGIASSTVVPIAASLTV
jgi:hypothetical protein